KVGRVSASVRVLVFLLLGSLGLPLLRRRLPLQDLPVLGDVDVRGLPVLHDLGLVERPSVLGLLLDLVDLHAGALLVDRRFHRRRDLSQREVLLVLLRRPDRRREDEDGRSREPGRLHGTSLSGSDARSSDATGQSPRHGVRLASGGAYSYERTRDGTGRVLL